MKTELRMILKTHKSKLISCVTEGMLLGLLAKMDIYLDDLDVQMIKCEMQNNGKSSAAFQLFSCLQSADDSSFKELLAFLQENKATKSVYSAISNECTKSGLQSILPRERNVSGEICEKSEKGNTHIYVLVPFLNLPKPRCILFSYTYFQKKVPTSLQSVACAHTGFFLRLVKCTQKHWAAHTFFWILESFLRPPFFKC